MFSGGIKRDQWHKMSYRFCKIHWKAPVPESFFNKVEGFQTVTLHIFISNWGQTSVLKIAPQ